MLGATVGTLAGMNVRHLGLVRETANRLSGKEAEAWHSHLSGVFRQGLPKAEPVSEQKFALLVDLGTITVPEDYVHGTRLKSFREKNGEKLCHYDGDINDENFPNPIRVLKPGDKLRVRAFKQTVRGTTSEERMAFLATQKAVFPGAQGASLVWEQKRDELPRDYWHASVDEEERLWRPVNDHHKVPGFLVFSHDAFNFSLVSFEHEWQGNLALLCFCDLSAEASAKAGEPLGA